MTAPVGPARPSVFARYRKAIGSFLGALVGVGGALLSLGVLSGPVSHDLAVGLAAATPILSLLGTAVTAPNATEVAVATTTAAAVQAVVAEYQAIVSAVGAPTPPPAG
jgi:hypothetical protein